MVLTQLDGKVAPEHWDRLKQAFEAAKQPLPAEIYQSYLVQDANEQERWRVVTIWHSQEALRRYRNSIETPEGVLMFRAVGTEPTLTIFDVIEHGHNQP